MANGAFEATTVRPPLSSPIFSIITNMNDIIRHWFTGSLFDAIGVGILGSLIGSILAISSETTTAGTLLSVLVGSSVGATGGAIVGVVLRGYGGAALGLIGGVMLGISTGDFKWVLPGVVVGPIAGALAGPTARATVGRIRGFSRDHSRRGA